VVLEQPRVLAAFLPFPSEHRLAEAFLDGELELDGDAVALLEAAARWPGPRLRAGLLTAALSVMAHRFGLRGGDGIFARPAAEARHSPGRDRAAVQHHYDLSDDFYRLFLDAGMAYSCAYFPGGDESLEEAQRAKLELVCRKLSLAPGERFLDVGCGWGALLEHAAGAFGARGLGITLSANQLEFARRRLAPLGDAARVEPADYRSVAAAEPFQKVASVGMMEHVGRRRLAGYLSAVHRLLAPGGLFLNHAIADLEPGNPTVGWARRGRSGFLDRYIFPDGELLPIGEVVAAAERAGFEVRDLESLREHYDRTLVLWLSRLEARWDEAVALVGARRARAYRLYLAGSAVSFRLGRVSVFQLLLARPAPGGRIEGLPRRRADWYAPPAGARRAG
jgi:cyclopropane-fatty-acyl-phospholipid synthase